MRFRLSIKYTWYKISQKILKCRFFSKLFSSRGPRQTRTVSSVCVITFYTGISLFLYSSHRVLHLPLDMSSYNEVPFGRFSNDKWSNRTWARLPQQDNLKVGWKLTFKQNRRNNSSQKLHCLRKNVALFIFVTSLPDVIRIGKIGW